MSPAGPTGFGTVDAFRALTEEYASRQRTAS